MNDDESDVPTYLTFPEEDHAKLNSPIPNPIERLDCENKRRTKIIGIFPNDQPIVQLAGVIRHEVTFVSHQHPLGSDRMDNLPEVHI